MQIDKEQIPDACTGMEHSWKTKLIKLESIVFLCYAFSLVLPITIPWIVLVVGLIVSIVLAIIRSKEGTDSYSDFRQIGHAPLTVLIAVFALVVSISGFFNGGFRECWASFATLRALIVYFWAYQKFVRDPDLRIKCVQVLMITGGISGVWAAIQQVGNIHPFGFRYLQGTGFLSGPMAFAGEMQIYSMLALAFLLSTERLSFSLFRNKFLLAILAVGNVLGVVFASERSAWLGALAGLTIMVLLLSRKLVWKTAIALALIGLLAWFTMPVFQKRLAPLMQWQQDVSVRVRFQMWDEAIKLFERSPIIGIGVRNFPHIYIPEAIVPGRSKYLDHAHSNYLHVLATTGIIGLVVYLSICFVTLKTAWVQYKSDPDRSGFDRSVALGILAATVSLMVAGFFEYNFGTGQVRLMQWFALAMMLT
jgi:O-antigen ligase